MSDVIVRQPNEVIRDIHMLAEEMGGQRVRVDRTLWSDGSWIEVGYASGEIHIRTNVGRKLRYRAAVDKVEMDGVIDLFENLLDWNPEEGPQ